MRGNPVLLGNWGRYNQI